MRNDGTGRSDAAAWAPGAVRAAEAWLDRCAALYGLAPGSVGLVVGIDLPPSVLASADGDAVRVAPAVLAGMGRGEVLARLVLAHEAAHVAQARLGTAPGGEAGCEAEAAVAAVSAMAGRPFTCRVAVPAGGRLHWGRVGHYYTVYLMALACGATADQAFRMALYTQIPDLVAELDAIACALDYYLLDNQKRMVLSYYHAGEAAVAEAVVTVAGTALQAGVIASTVVNPWSWSTNLQTARDIGAGTRAVNGLVQDEGVAHITAALQAEAKMKLDFDVQRGLHCLTGRPALEERAKREKLLMDLAWGSREFGLALHAFGDSFAHTQLSGPQDTYNTGFGHFRDFHAPDVVSKHADTYLLYCRTLYDLFARKTSRKLLDQSAAIGLFEALVKVGVAAEASADAYNQAQILRYANNSWMPSFVPREPVRLVNAEESEEGAQIKTIRGMAAGAPFNAPIPYLPPDEAVPWMQFHASVRPPPRDWPHSDDLRWMLAKAVEWSGSS